MKRRPSHVPTAGEAAAGAAEATVAIAVDAGVEDVPGATAIVGVVADAPGPAGVGCKQQCFPR
jgi:hypothetical protein